MFKYQLLNCIVTTIKSMNSKRYNKNLFTITTKKIRLNNKINKNIIVL